MTTLLFLLFFAQSEGSWHDRFIEGNCEACPECCVSEDDCTEAVPVRAFEPTPCTGVLWPAEHTAKALEVMKVDLPECNVKLSVAKEQLKICDATIIRTREQCDETLNRFADLTKKAAHIERPWWDNNSLWGGAGFISGILVTVLIAKAVGGPF